MVTEMNWYVLYTRPKWEKKVDHQLKKKNIESYCPMNRVARQWADRKKLLEVPLFSSYVFVRTSPLESVKIKQTEGVLNFVFWLGKPAIVRNEEMAAIRQFTTDYREISVEKSGVSVNDRIRVTEGPLVFLEGHVLEVKTTTVKVQLPSLCCVLSAEVNKGSIEIIRSAVPGKRIARMQ